MDVKKTVRREIREIIPDSKFGSQTVCPARDETRTKTGLQLCAHRSAVMLPACPFGTNSRKRVDVVTGIALSLGKR
jgi:hypothetical protein